MLKTQNNFVFLVFCAIFLTSSVGCDMVTSIKESMGGKDKEKTAAKPKAVAKAVSAKKADMNKPMAENVLVRIGDWSITVDEFTDRLEALKEVLPEYDVANVEAKRMVLDELVRQQLLVLDAEKTGLAKQKDIESAVEEFRRTLIVREVAANLTENIKVSEEEAKAFYEENKDQLISPPQFRVSELVVDSQSQANELLIEILKGADFGEMAKAHSISDSAPRGGDLGILEEEPFPQMVGALLSLEEGDVSSVFKGPDGYYIIKLQEKTGGDTISFEEIKEEIIQNRTLFKQQEVILDRISKIKETIDVEVNESLLK